MWRTEWKPLIFMGFAVSLEGILTWSEDWQMTFRYLVLTGENCRCYIYKQNKYKHSEELLQCFKLQFSWNKSPSARLSTTPYSLPGFPKQHQYNYPNIPNPKVWPEISVSLTTIPDPNPSILTANIYALSEAFHYTKLQLTPKQEIYVLFIRVEKQINKYHSYTKCS